MRHKHIREEGDEGGYERECDLERRRHNEARDLVEALFVVRRAGTVRRRNDRAARHT